jgi:hypothetical protein
MYACWEQEVCEHLEAANLVPEAYAQKWFVGLCVHAMPFETLVEVIESFLSEGHLFLFKLSVAIVTAIKDQILTTKTHEAPPTRIHAQFPTERLIKRLSCSIPSILVPSKKPFTSSISLRPIEAANPTTHPQQAANLTAVAQVNKLFELLRLDRKLFPDDDVSFFASIVEGAKEVELSTEEVANLREEQWKLLQAKLEKVRAREQELKDQDDESDGIEFSDEDSDEEVEPRP